MTDEIISMVVHNNVLYVAKKSGVYVKDGDGKFHKLTIEETKSEVPVLLQKQATPFPHGDNLYVDDDYLKALSIS